ncbi:glycerol-3-phosphate acyltransferase [Candidatus Phytoplasma luffae]|uniref:Glycerol-3-phosphate acyltransferase n=1 Tax=Loofah witches'-broom phytoplasma TaxID=35773 RepID=A0A975ILW2_LOWBP|nr:glycerol-3-phosphate 1-O-acyltransferase PlsY [Candidatus Phytoplasma luffae]QTX02753.1 glycerol-3-phosphate acyltransferase [Candidatus Phytoplasma luffae]
MFTQIIIIILCYLIGSIPMGLIISKLFFNKDLRLLGSKNIGATNAFRILGFKYGVIVFILDFLKGFLIIHLLNDEENVLKSFCIISIILGHIFSIFNKFKGGKAIATSVGVVASINLPIGIVGILFFIIFIIISGYASLSSILATTLVNILLWIHFFRNNPKNLTQTQLIIISLITILIFYKHKINIINLINGKENKFNFSYFKKK